MKLFNIFKKEASKEVKSNVQKMDKTQLSKVIGGGGPEVEAEETTSSGGKKGGKINGTIVVNSGN